MKIKYIFLDLGGVLLINKAAEVGDKYKQKYGINPDLFRKIFTFIQSQKRSEIELKQYLTEIGIAPKMWQNYQNDFYSSECRNDELYKLLESLKPRIKIFFTTNNSDKLLPVIEKYQIGSLADWILNSSEAHISKPDPKFWQLAFNKVLDFDISAQKQDVLVIDDSNTNIQSALDYELQAFLYKPGSEATLVEILNSN